MDHELEIILTRLKTFLLIKIITITVNTFLPMRNKFVYSCSIKILSSGFNELLESIFCLLLGVDGEGNGIPSPVLLPGKSHGQRSLVGCSPWGRYESDTTGQLHFHFSLSSIGEGNGNPLQCSCLENHRDRGAWWAAVSGVAQSRTRLK